ncbi:MAG TPA: DUF4387 family protein [Ramlibacter sp.]|jgi:hypothetical protein|nr:DUF4387 family protein [Ramlibacter sp.]
MSSPPARASADAVPLAALARVVRSKNAGPTLLTIDLFFRDAAAYRRAAASESLSEASIGRLYAMETAHVQRYLLPDILAIKFSMPRAVCAGDPGDGDVYGAQQHAPMLGLML